MTTLGFMAEMPLQAVVEKRGLAAVRRCYQCRKCTNGCPLTFAMDWLPHQVVRAVQLGLDQQVLGSKTIWVCAACQTCSTRCPNDIDIAHLMDILRQESRRLQVEPAEPEVLRFHEAFLDSVRRHGRVFELGMLARYKLTSLWASLRKGRQSLKDLVGQLWQDARLGWGMFRRGRLRLWPHRIQARDQLRLMGGTPIEEASPGQSTAGPASQTQNSSCLLFGDRTADEHGQTRGMQQ